MRTIRERAARALCRQANLPENTSFEGRPMWMSYLDDADAVIEAIGLDGQASELVAHYDEAHRPISYEVLWDSS